MHLPINWCFLCVNHLAPEIDQLQSSLCVRPPESAFCLIKPWFCNKFAINSLVGRLHIFLTGWCSRSFVAGWLTDQSLYYYELCPKECNATALYAFQVNENLPKLLISFVYTHQIEAPINCPPFLFVLCAGPPNESSFLVPAAEDDQNRIIVIK